MSSDRTQKDRDIKVANGAVSAHMSTSSLRRWAASSGYPRCGSLPPSYDECNFAAMPILADALEDGDKSDAGIVGVQAA